MFKIRDENMELDMNGVVADKAIEMGFSKFNNGPHLLVEIPNGGSTISCMTSEGHMVTFSFQPYTKDGAPQCIDIKHHSTTIVPGTSVPGMNATLWTPGKPLANGLPTGNEPCTLVSVVFKHKK